MIHVKWMKKNNQKLRRTLQTGGVVMNTLSKFTNLTTDHFDQINHFNYFQLFQNSNFSW
jgi:hypothetical protein